MVRRPLAPLSLALLACAPRPGGSASPGPDAPPAPVASAAALPAGEDEAPPRAAPLPVVLPEMIAIPAGEVVLGATGGAPDELPVRVLSLSAYSIDRVEVDVGAYALCVAAGACTAAGKGEGCNAARLDRAHHPINCISWAQADAYCRYAKKRLPTEAEWERAARSGDRRGYVWGDEWPPPRGADNFADAACSKARPYWTPVEGGYDDGFADTAPVDAPSASTLQGGLHFAGNVAEWVADWYDPQAYASATARDPAGAKKGKARVLRGASFGSARAQELRVTRRAYYDPTKASMHFGVRCARSG